MRRASRHPVTEHLPFDDHRAMAAYWGDQALYAIRQAVAHPTYTTHEDLALNQAVRATRMAVWHAAKVTTNRRTRKGD